MVNQCVNQQGILVAVAILFPRTVIYINLNTEISLYLSQKCGWKKLEQAEFQSAEPGTILN